MHKETSAPMPTDANAWNIRFPMFWRRTLYGRAAAGARPWRKKRGFTLIELLVVIAVVAVLLTLVVGVISQVRVRSQGVRCMAKLRNVSGMFSLYALENDNYYPAVRQNNATEDLPQGESWMMVLQKFMNFKFPDANTDSYLECPTARETFPGQRARRTYAMNHAGTGNNTVPIRPDDLQMPGQTILLVDGSYNAGDGSGDSFSSVGISDYSRNIDWRHHGGTNALFYDGHVENIHHSETERLETLLLNYMKRN